MEYSLNPELRKAVREYYQWNGDKHGSAARIVSRPGRFGREYMVLAHVTSAEGDKLSTLMFFNSWADGHYDVTEDVPFPRECEERYLKAWRDEGREDVKLYKVQCEHEEECNRDATYEEDLEKEDSYDIASEYVDEPGIDDPSNDYDGWEHDDKEATVL